MTHNHDKAAWQDGPEIWPEHDAQWHETASWLVPLVVMLIPRGVRHALEPLTQHPIVLYAAHFLADWHVGTDLLFAAGLGGV